MFTETFTCLYVCEELDEYTFGCQARVLKNVKVLFYKTYS